jgi:enoyl-CoA hydratase/carnithine racemase
MATPLVLYEVDDKVGIITLNRPDKLNAISHELQHALTETFTCADADPTTSVVLLRAEGRSFCAGYDIGAKGPGADDWRTDPTKAHAHLQPQLEFEMMPWLMTKPVIASVQGHVLGGGCELVMLCDLTIAADNATFGEPEVRFSAVGPAIVMPMIIGYKKARELLYFGDRIDAQTALDLGRSTAWCRSPSCSPQASATQSACR